MSQASEHKDGEQQTFKTVAAVVRFLKAKGYKVEKSKVYQDKRKGLLRCADDGTIAEDDALAYAVRADLGKVTDAIAEVDQYAGVRSKKEIEKLEVQTEKLRFELEKERGRYILKEDVQLQVAIKLSALEAGIKNVVRVNAADWIHKTGGDAKKERMLCELVYAEVDALLGEFGNMEEINVTVQKR